MPQKKKRPPIKITPTMAARSARILAINARTKKAQAEIDAFIKGADMRDLKAFPVMARFAKIPPAPPPIAERKPRAPRAKGPIAPPVALDLPKRPLYTGELKQYRCSFCTKKGHNRQKCAERKAFELALQARTPVTGVPVVHSYAGAATAP